MSAVFTFVIFFKRWNLVKQDVAISCIVKRADILSRSFTGKYHHFQHVISLQLIAKFDYLLIETKFKESIALVNCAMGNSKTVY